VLILSALKEANGQTHFVIHANCTSYGMDLPPAKFLQSLGFSEFRGKCQFHETRCYWVHVAQLKYIEDGLTDDRQVSFVHAGFRTLADKMNEIYETVRLLNRMTRDIGFNTPIPKIITDPIVIEPLPGIVPAWVDENKFVSLQELEKRADDLKSKILDLRSYLPLLYESGEALEDAVLLALTRIGLKASKTQKGFTADILAEDATGQRKFGLEVTGINGAIKKDSNKLTQLQEFDRIKENNEKTILVANTFRDKPIAERLDAENFTQPVVNYFSNQTILMMASYDLYRLVEDVIENRRTPEEVIGLLYDSNSVFIYQAKT
jgi:hypothetical protein